MYGDLPRLMLYPTGSADRRGFPTLGDDIDEAMVEKHKKREGKEKKNNRRKQHQALRKWANKSNIYKYRQNGEKRRVRERVEINESSCCCHFTRETNNEKPKMRC